MSLFWFIFTVLCCQYFFIIVFLTWFSTEGRRRAKLIEDQTKYQINSTCDRNAGNTWYDCECRCLREDTEILRSIRNVRAIHLETIKFLFLGPKTGFFMCQISIHKTLNRVGLNENNEDYLTTIWTFSIFEYTWINILQICVALHECKQIFFFAVRSKLDGYVYISPQSSLIRVSLLATIFVVFLLGTLWGRLRPGLGPAPGPPVLLSALGSPPGLPVSRRSGH